MSEKPITLVEAAAVATKLNIAMMAVVSAVADFLDNAGYPDWTGDQPYALGYNDALRDIREAIQKVADYSTDGPTP